MATYPYLNDNDFLKKIDNLQTKEIFVKIISLSWSEIEISNIEGLVTNGTININGNSAVRRTCSLTMQVGDMPMNEVKDLISIDKKIKLEIGVTNSTTFYPEYPILWYPMGLFIITDVSYTHNLQGISISLSLKDKMCMLNGFCGGVIPATTDFQKADISTDPTVVVEEYPTIYRIIEELVCHFGGEDVNNINIDSTLGNKIRQAVKWDGDKNKKFLVYHIPSSTENSEETNNIASSENGLTEDTPDWWYMLNETQLNKFLTGGREAIDEDPKEGEAIASTLPLIPINIEEEFLGWDGTHEYEDETGKTFIYEQGDDLGYKYVDFIYNESLIGQVGNNVCTILEKIKNKLGNYEYFYNLDGQFIFQEKQNFLNIAPEDFNQEFVNNFAYITPERYMVQYDSGQSQYEFNDGNIITSYVNSPKYDSIKNNYTIWGKKNLLRYHLAIDTKPELGKKYSYALFPTDDNIRNTERTIKLLKFEKPSVGLPGYLYKDSSGKYWIWRTAAEQKAIINKKIIDYTNKKEEFQEIIKIISKCKEYSDNIVVRYAEFIEEILFNLREKTTKVETTEENIDSTLDNASLNVTTILSRIIGYCEKYPRNMVSYFQYIDNLIDKIDIVIKYIEKIYSLYSTAAKYLKEVVTVENPNHTALDAANKLKEAKNLICGEAGSVENPQGPAIIAGKTLYKYILEQDYDTGKPVSLPEKEYGAKTLLWALSFEASSPLSLIASFFLIEDLEKERITTVENEAAKDWREELFLQGLEAEMNNEVTSFYYKELKSEWTKIYDMKNHCFYEDFLKNPWNYNFFLDFIEDDPEHDIIVSNLSIKEVGDRQTASTVESINCIFEPTPKNTIIINLDDLPEEIAIQKQWAQINEYNILYFPNELFENLGIGGTKNSAFEYIKSMLHEWVSYNEAITIQCLPIYHLEPNTRIKVEDSDSNIFGEYVISSISIPLDIKGTMSITATRALEKF